MDKRVELYEITGEYADAAAALMECDTDEEYAAALSVLDEVEADLTANASAMAMTLRNMQARQQRQAAHAAAFKAEYDRLNARAKATEAAAERLKERVLFAMETAGMERIRTDIGTWYIGKSISCSVTDPDKVPAEFVKAYTPEIDKAAAKKHYEFTGELIDGIEFIHGRTARFR